MPESLHTNNDYKINLTENQLNTTIELLGRTPTEHEIEIICFLLSKKSRIDAISDNSETTEVTHDFKWVLKSELVELDHQADFEDLSASLTCNLISKVLKSNAKPLALVNSLNIDSNKVSDEKEVLHQIIKGSGKMSNVLGIPNLKTNVFFHSGSQYLHSAAIGLANGKRQSTSLKKGQKYIYLLGRYQHSTEDKPASISSYHYKFLKEVLEEQFSSEDEIIIENINDGGLVNSTIKLIKEHSKGITLDISGLFNDLSKLNFTSLLNPQHSPVLVIPENETKLKETATKWELNYQIIGQVEDEQNLCIIFNNKQLANIPIKKLLNNKSLFADNEINKGKLLKAGKFNITKIKLPKKTRDIAWSLISNPSIASKNCINEQYDSMVGISNMNSSFLSDAEVLNLKGTNNALAVSLVNRNNCLGPGESTAKIALAELNRKMVCTGAKPLVAIVNILQSPTLDTENLICEVKKVAEKLNIVASFSVKQNKDSDETIQTYFSMLGLIEDKNHHMTMSFKDKGNIIFLIGPSSENLAGSEYLLSYHKSKSSYMPDFDINIERKINQAMLELIGKNLICSAHNVSKGGLFISLVESAMVFGFGFDIITDTDIRTDAFLFGESPGRVIVSVTPNKEDKFIDFMMQKDIPFLAIGHVTKGEMRVDDISYGFINDAKKEYNSALKRFLNKDF